MASGAICTNGRYKVGGAFTAASAAVYDDSSTTPTYKWYSSEIGGWLANAGVEAGAAPTALGQTSSVVNGATAYKDSGLATTEGTVRNTMLYSITKSISGDGTVAITSGTTYGSGRYVETGTSVTLTATAGSERVVTEFKVNGTSQTSPYTFTITGDATVEAKFCYSSYYASAPSVSSGGTVAVYKNNALVSTFPVSVVEDDVIKYVCTPSLGYSFSYIDIDGNRSATTTTEVTVVARTNDQTIDAVAHFSSAEVITNAIEKTGDGTIGVTDANGTAVAIGSDGSFSCYRGATYNVTATPGTGKYVEGVYEGTRKVSSTVPYQFVQYGSSLDFTVVFAAGSGKGVESVKCGSSSAATSDSPWNGCSCTYTNSGDSYTFTATAASGYAFQRFYIEDLGGTGKGCVKTDNPSTLTVDFRAKVVAIFKDNTSPTEPADADQGNATQVTDSIGEWEGGLTRMRAKWASRRNVFFKPVSLSCARVYADAYDSGSPHLKILQYQSPSKTDVAYDSVSVIVPSQNAIRLRARRPEKYVEVLVESTSPVLYASVGTSMEALCRNT